MDVNKDVTSRICVIVPTYNNGGTLTTVVNDIRNYIKDIIIVNDGSTNNTLETLHSLEDITIVTHNVNKGKGAALVSGFRKAKTLGYTHALTIDADGQHFASDIPRFLDDYENKGLIIGYRNLTEENMPGQNTFANKFSDFWFKLQTLIDLPDTQSGFRLYPLNSLCGLTFITSRYESELELLVFAAWSGCKISTIPICVYYPPEGERVTHFRPIYDFIRITVLNIILCLLALVYGWPRTIARRISNSLS